MNINNNHRPETRSTSSRRRPRASQTLPHVQHVHHDVQHLVHDAAAAQTARSCCCIIVFASYRLQRFRDQPHHFLYIFHVFNAVPFTTSTPTPRRHASSSFNCIRIQLGNDSRQRFETRLVSSSLILLHIGTTRLFPHLSFYSAVQTAHQLRVHLCTTREYIV